MKSKNLWGINNEVQTYSVLKLLRSANNRDEIYTIYKANKTPEMLLLLSWVLSQASAIVTTKGVL